MGLEMAARRAYLRPMSWFPRPVGPRAAIADLAAALRGTSREQKLGAVLAVLATSIIIIEFTVDSKINTAPPATIVYVEQWSANRTDAEIMAEQKQDQAEREAAQRERQRQFQKLQNQLGIE